MFCPKCGAQLLEGAEFCQKCGAKLRDNGATSQGIETLDRQESVVAGDAKAMLPNAVKAGKLQKFAKYGEALIWISLALLFLSLSIRLPISPLIFVFGAILGIFLSALGMKKPLRISKIIELVSAGIVLVVMMVVSLGSGDGNDKYIQTVKNGTFEAYPQKTVGEAFDNYLTNAVWESGKAEDGQIFVNVKGGISYEGNNAEIIVQFFLDEDEELFQYNACEINGVPQNDLIALYLFDTIFTDGAAVTTPDSKEDSYVGNRMLIGETQMFDDESFGNLEVTLDYVEFCDKYNDIIGRYVYPEEGCVFLCAGVTVKNIGTENGTLPTAWNTVIYDGIYEFRESSSCGDIMDIKPLTPSKSGVLIYMVPTDVAESEESLVLNIDNGSETLISYTIRPGSKGESENQEAGAESLYPDGMSYSAYNIDPLEIAGYYYGFYGQSIADISIYSSPEGDEVGNIRLYLDSEVPVFGGLSVEGQLLRIDMNLYCVETSDFSLLLGVSDEEDISIELYIGDIYVETYLMAEHYVS